MRTFAESAKYVVETLRSFGLEVHPASRLGKMYRTLVAPDGSPAPFIPEGSENFAVALEAIRDVQQLAFILDYISLPDLPPDFQNRLKLLLKDSVLPQDDIALTKGRDTQCEFFVAAICAKGNLNPLLHEQPDLRIEMDGETFGIAVKRCKSLAARGFMPHAA